MYVTNVVKDKMCSVEHGCPQIVPSRSESQRSRLRLNILVLKEKSCHKDMKYENPSWYAMINVEGHGEGRKVKHFGTKGKGLVTRIAHVKY